MSDHDPRKRDRDRDRDRERRRRDPDSPHNKKHHARRKSRDPGGKPKLSMDALAQLDEMHSRGGDQIPEPSRARRPRDHHHHHHHHRHRRDEDEIVVLEPDEYESSPRRERARNHREHTSYRNREHSEGGEYRKTRRHRDESGTRRIRDERHRDDEPETPRRARRPHVYSEPEPEPEPEFDDGEEGYTSWEQERRRHRRKKKRIVSGAIVEEGRATIPPGIRGGAGGSKHSSYNSVEQEKLAQYNAQSAGWSWKNIQRKKKKWIYAGVGLVVLIIIIIVAVVVSKQNGSDTPKKDGDDIGSVDPDSVPTYARGTYLDPFTWYDTTDLNVTYTNETVGGLPVMGLFTEWDDSTVANSKVPPLNKPWGDYATKPARGVNLGGWLSLEPFITPSLFDYDIRLGIVDEWTLCKHLGPKTTASTLEKHYATFVTEQTFKEIQDAGLDHVRIPYSYWAVQIYDDDPYLFRVSWRYLLRGIEWARKYGLRVNLDLHALPGSQNGWNHSGRQGPIGWLNGTNGDLNAQRSLDVHDRLSKFFAQDRYKNIVTFYGLANEPQMVRLSAEAVTKWTSDAYNLIRDNGLEANVVFADGFMGLTNWHGSLTGHPGLILDVHQYVIFNNGLIQLSHQEKIKYACDGWTEQAEESQNPATGFGPTMFAEWSQADTDCAKYLTNVGWGNRWAGTYDSGNASTQALTPKCPTTDDRCTCEGANASVSDYSDAYKKFLRMFAEAQMTSFEKGWGWWYWTWDTESAPQWSYRQGLAAGILPKKAYDRDFTCDGDIPDFTGLGLDEVY